MNSVSSIALSGMQAAQAGLDSASHNIANNSTPRFQRQQVVQTEDAQGGVSTSLTKAATEGSALETDLVNQKQALYSFLANASVIKTSHAMAGTLLNEKA